ncbi:MAG TPA: DUF5103 domain-containing protein [Chitinophagaceae bacterium]|nr:DUF5103 domain-containing protein [Chitinophagaceae bacterium]
MRIALCFVLLSACMAGRAQTPDKIYAPGIHNIKLNVAGNQLLYPVIALNGSDQLELNFDDLEGGIRSYSYTWQLCNADWSTAQLSVFDYIKGFTQNRINTYRTSSIATVKYTHYTVTLPERSCIPSRSGNYLLKVFADGDTANLLFTRRVLVVDQKASIPVQVQQPFNGQFFKTHQKLQFTVGLGNSLNTFNPMQQVKVCILQNWRWDNCIFDIHPTMARQNTLEFNTESDALFPGGREWRWLDLRSFRLLSDRVKNAGTAADGTTLIEVKPDIDRSAQRMVFYKDNNGHFYNDISESVNYLWQADYARVHFSFVPPGNQVLAGRQVFLFGELTNYGQDEKAKMVFNPEKGVYETELLLKNGYYDYYYVTTEAGNPRSSIDYTEGSFWETENDYTILVYFRPIGGRSDELIGLAGINSLTGRSGY